MNYIIINFKINMHIFQKFRQIIRISYQKSIDIQVKNLFSIYICSRAYLKHHAKNYFFYLLHPIYLLNLDKKTFFYKILIKLNYSRNIHVHQIYIYRDLISILLK